MPELHYEALDIMKMELPPGWRGYGSKDQIEHPDTARRLQDIEHISGQQNSADRHSIQHSLLPFREFLPLKYRGYNQRLEEDGSE
jgi:fumarate reductase flavoprotein subunit